MSFETYKKLTATEIHIKLLENGERTDFGHPADRGCKFSELEDAAYALDINFDSEKALEYINMGADLGDTLAYSQVEFCCE
tara:strand:+ start:6204 stop:6446 length:243 start_codon:yes stop_codon:yes gene_type:complete